MATARCCAAHITPLSTHASLAPRAELRGIFLLFAPAAAENNRGDTKPGNAQMEPGGCSQTHPTMCTYMCIYQTHECSQPPILSGALVSNTTTQGFHLWRVKASQSPQRRMTFKSVGKDKRLKLATTVQYLCHLFLTHSHMK